MDETISEETIPVYTESEEKHNLPDDAIIIEEEAPDREFFCMMPTCLKKLGLSSSALAFYFILKTTAGERATCWKSKNNLAKEFGCSPRNLIRLKKELAKPRKELGGKALIKIFQRKKASSNAQTTDVIFITNIWEYNLKLSLPGDKNDTGGVTKMSPLKEEYSKEKKDLSKERSKDVANAPSPILSFGEFKRVKLKQKDYDDLEKRFGKQKLQDLITAVDGNYEERGVTRKNYKASIVNWERREKTFNPKAKKEDLIAKNREYAKNVVKNLRKNFIPNEITFDAYATYFELGSRNHSQSKIISFSESGFKDQLENELRRRNALQYLN